MFIIAINLEDPYKYPFEDNTKNTKTKPVVISMTLLLTLK